MQLDEFMLAVIEGEANDKQHEEEQFKPEEEEQKELKVDSPEVCRAAKVFYSEQLEAKGGYKWGDKSTAMTKELFHVVARDSGRKRGARLDDPRMKTFVERA